MPELEDVLLELRDIGVAPLPHADDAGARRGRQTLAQELAHARTRAPWTRRKLAIGGFGVAPALLVAVVATAAAATGGAVYVSRASHATHQPPVKPTTIFKRNPGAPHMRHDGRWLFRKETVIPASVHARASVTVPHYGRVQFWSATTKQGGFCSALKLPDGAWAGYPFSPHSAGGFDGGTVPGCIDTEQQRSIGEQGALSVEAPTKTEGFDDLVKSRRGKTWALLYGYVTTQRYAASVRDPVSGRTARVTPGGYFLLAEPPTGTAADELEVLNAAGRPLQPDYTRGGLLPGYRMGPTPPGGHG